MTDCIVKSILRYGNEIMITNDDKSIQTRAFIEPLKYKNHIYIGGENYQIGSLANQKFLYIGYPHNSLIEDKTIITYQDKEYLVKRAERYFIKDIVVYIWAILIPVSK